MTAPVATASFLLAADDVLAHLQFLPVAFIGKEACSWEYGSRHFLLQVTAMGEYIVSIGPSVLPVTSPTDTPASNTYANEEAGDGNGSLPDEAAMKAAAASPYSVIVAPFDDMPDELKPSEIACRIACTPEALLTCLAGAPAELLASDVGAMQQFLSAFRFDGYAEFCEARHMRPYVPAATGSSAPDAINQMKRSFIGLADNLGRASRSATTSINESFQKMGAMAAAAVPKGDKVIVPKPSDAVEASASPAAEAAGEAAAPAEGEPTATAKKPDGGAAPFGSKQWFARASASSAEWFGRTTAKVQSVLAQPVAFAAKLREGKLGAESKASLSPPPRLVTLSLSVSAGGTVSAIVEPVREAVEEAPVDAEVMVEAVVAPDAAIAIDAAQIEAAHKQGEATTELGEAAGAGERDAVNSTEAANAAEQETPASQEQPGGGMPIDTTEPPVANEAVEEGAQGTTDSGEPTEALVEDELVCGVVDPSAPDLLMAEEAPAEAGATLVPAAADAAEASAAADGSHAPSPEKLISFD